MRRLFTSCPWISKQTVISRHDQPKAVENHCTKADARWVDSTFKIFCISADSWATTAAVCAASGVSSRAFAACKTPSTMELPRFCCCLLLQAKVGRRIHSHDQVYLEGKVVSQGVCAADTVVQVWPSNHHPTSMLCGILNPYMVLWEGRKPQT